MSLALIRSVSVVSLCGVMALAAGCMSTGVRKPTIHPVVFEPDGNAGPTAQAPARMAVARVGYPEHYHDAREDGTARVLSIYETPEEVSANEFAQLPAALDGVRDVLVIQPDMAVHGPVDTPAELRAAARHYRSDLVLAFSVSIDRDTDYHFPILAVLTLGLAPNATAEVDGRAQAVLLDSRTGYIYERFDTTAETWQLANAWSEGEAEDQSQERVERRLLGQLLEQVKERWPGVAEQIGGVRVEPRGVRPVRTTTAQHRDW